MLLSLCGRHVGPEHVDNHIIIQLNLYDERSPSLLPMMYTGKKVLLGPIFTEGS